MNNIFEDGLEKNSANFAPLTPVSFLKRAAAVYGAKPAIVQGKRRITYAEFYARCCQFALALQARGIRRGDTVAILAPNVPAMLEAHYAVPMVGAVLNPINTRLDPATIAFILEHGEAKLVLCDKELGPGLAAALAMMKAPPPVIGIDDPAVEGGLLLGDTEYEALIHSVQPDDGGFDGVEPTDEWQAICLLYTSGTTGNPKGVVYHHRGAYLNALGNVISFGLQPSSIYLWTLPMFHCSGWCFTWAVTAVGATHVCLRKVDPAEVFRLIEQEKVTHLCGAPIVLNLLAHAPDTQKRPLPGPVQVMTGGAAPPSAIIENMERQGFSILHAYGLTETYGPAAACFWHEEWSDLALPQRAAKMAQQGKHYVTLQDVTVKQQGGDADVACDGAQIGEVVVRGNTVMKGYLKNPKATAEAFQGGWFHSGDLAVRHPDSYIEVKDRTKDIIISGGENISSLEVEEALYRHPKVLEAAVVARPDTKWGETPCAFVTLKEGMAATPEELITHCRTLLAHFKVPRTVVFGTLPKTSTGKIQKFELRKQAEALNS